MSWETLLSGILSTALKPLFKKTFKEVYVMSDFLISFAVSFLIGYLTLNGVPLKNLLAFSAIIALVNSLFLAFVVLDRNRQIEELEKEKANLTEENKKLRDENEKLVEEITNLKERNKTLNLDLENCKRNSDWLENFYKNELERVEKSCSEKVWRTYINSLTHIVRDFCQSEHIGRVRTQKFGTVDVYLVNNKMGQQIFIVPTETPTNVSIGDFIDTFWDIVLITKGKSKEEILNIVKSL